MFIYKRISRLILLGAACALITACADSERSSSSVRTNPTAPRAAVTATQIAQTSYSAAIVSGQPTFNRENGTTVTVEELQIRKHSDRDELTRRYFLAVLLDIAGTNEGGCIYARDVRLFASGEPIAPQTPDMMYVQDLMTPYRDYVGAIAGHCVDRGESKKSFVVFDVSVTSANFVFAIDDKQHPFSLRVRDPAAIRDYERFTFEDDAQRVALAPKPTSTPRPTATSTRAPQPTRTPTLTPNATATKESATRTPLASRTPIPPRVTRTPASVAQAAGTYYVTANANIRSCAATTCAALGRLTAGATFVALERVDGERVTGSNSTWYRFNHNGSDGFIYSGLASTSPVSAAAPPAARPGGSGGSSSAASPPTSAPAAPASSWSCWGDIYNCADFSNRSELMSYWNACPGDPSRLDRDKDGIPCED